MLRLYLAATDLLVQRRDADVLVVQYHEVSYSVSTLRGRHRLVNPRGQERRLKRAQRLRVPSPCRLVHGRWITDVLKGTDRDDGRVVPCRCPTFAMDDHENVKPRWRFTTAHYFCPIRNKAIQKGLLLHAR